MFGLGTIGEIGGLFGMNPIGSMTGTTSSLLTMFTGGLGENGSAIENIGMKFFDYFTNDYSKTKIKEIKTQTRMYGKIIPEIFGKVRVAGNIIWHSNITIKTIKNPPQISKTGVINSGSTTTAIASFAIALGCGPIDSVDAIYANEISINLSQISYTIYKGTETQIPNSTMQSYLGAENVPAFRGLAYIVFNDFHLENYNSSLPNFTFDVRRVNFLTQDTSTTDKPEQMIQGVNIIPATGECVYDTVIQTRHQMVTYNTKNGVSSKIKSSFGEKMNQSTASNLSDFVVSMQQMQSTLTNLKWVSLVVTWFADSIDISMANIYPAHEGYGYETFPDSWSVNGIGRSIARQISLVNSKLNYGGTVSDIAVIRGLQHLKSLGYKVCLYPMIFIDTPQKPWRGRMTGRHTDIDLFFDKQTGYKNFISHYARLGRELMDAFVIGSEMIGITSINYNNTFPGVQKFSRLADEIRSIVGSSVKLTYAADWSEYHHTNGGWFNMDSLWSNQNIDFIGIDAYFPLTNTANNNINVNDVIQGWRSGEGWDFYYIDSKKTQSAPLSPSFAWKNIEYFYRNAHTNPDGTRTSWIPSSKPIWFTEYGFPSVDCATNQPNVFYDATSIEGGLPLGSKGLMNTYLQEIAIIATEKAWANSNIVVQKNIWTWDARPYPSFPALTNKWSDSPNWQYGHFLNGKIGTASSLGDIVRYLCLKTGLSDNIIDTTGLSGIVLGFSIDEKTPAIQHISSLAKIYNFDAINSSGKLVFKMFTNGIFYDISSNDIVIENSNPCMEIIKNCDGVKDPRSIELIYINPNDSYKSNTLIATTNSYDIGIRDTYKINVIMTATQARLAGFNIGLNNKLQNIRYTFVLTSKYINIMPLDIICFTDKDKNKHLIQAQSITILNQSKIKISGVASQDLNDYLINIAIKELPAAENVVEIIPTNISILDINNIDNIMNKGFVNIYVATFGTLLNKKWTGCQLYMSYDNGVSYNFVNNITTESIIGQIVSPLDKNINSSLIDYSSQMKVFFKDLSNIKSTTIDNMLCYQNLALIGQEIISFQSITQIDSNTLLFNGLLRGRFGTENYINSHIQNESFILLNKSLLTKISIPINSIGQNLLFKAVSAFDSIYDTQAVQFTLYGNSNKPFPVISDNIKLIENDFYISFIPRPNCENDFYMIDSIPNFQYHIVIKDRIDNSISQIACYNNKSAIYSRDQQIRDFEAVQTKIQYSIQPSAIY